MLGEKIHPWRTCARGHHLREGTEQVWNLPTGQKSLPISARLGRNIAKCIKNESPKDRMHFTEMFVIASNHFPQLKGPPKRSTLKYDHINEFDWLIRGWTRYWNEIFELPDPLDPILVKALIGSESTFNPDPPPVKSGAAGLMQLLEKTRRILGDPKGELKDHLVIIRKEEIFHPVVNICGGIRWLFRKRETASSRLKRHATWEEAVAHYKSYLPQYLKTPDYRGMKTFRDLFRRLKA